MKTFILAIIFTINGQPAYIEGWEPRMQPDAETCIERAANVRTYLNVNSPYPFEVRCVAE